MNDPDALVKEFLVESYENLDRLDRDLVALEKDPKDRERLSSIFRTIHTIKGTCGFFGFSKLESVTHVGENMLSRLRDGLFQLDPERTSALLALVDAVRVMLANIENTGHDGDHNYQELIDRLTPLLDGETPVEKGHEQMQDVPEPVSTPQEQKSAIADTNIRVDVGLLDQLMNLVGELVLARNQILQFNARQRDTAFLNTTQRLNLITSGLQEGVMKMRMQPIGNIWNRFPRIVRDLATSCGKEVRLEMMGKETEVDKTIIEAIKDPLTHIVRNAVDHGIEKPEVRKAGGKPAAGTLCLHAFHEGGQVNIEIIDDGAGVDSERVKSKAIERGLINREQAAVMSDGEATQLLFLPGFSTAEKVTNVSGRGVGLDVVKTNIEKIGGTVNLQSKKGQGTTLKIKIPLTLTIIPALIVTSGGDRFAIPQVSLLEIVRLEGDQAKMGIEHIHFAPVYRLRGQLLPLVFLNQELNGNQCSVASGQGPVASENNTPPTGHGQLTTGHWPLTTPHLPLINIVVLQTIDRKFGLVIEEIIDTEEIVVKPMGKLLKDIPVFAGATIMGDGQVSLILDVNGIAQRVSVVPEIVGKKRNDTQPQATGPSPLAPDHSPPAAGHLLLGVGPNRRVAIPLSMIARLEEIPAGHIEHADNREVVQYRGQIMPLFRLANLLGAEGSDDRADPMQVVVLSEQGRSVGLVVDRILDIVEASPEVQGAKHKGGNITSAVIQQRVTDLLDIQSIIHAADPSFLDQVAAV